MQVRHTRGVTAWLVPGLFLGAVLTGVTLVRAGSQTWFVVVLVGLVVLPAAWVLVSALSPARSDRRCPACGQEALARRSPDSTQGLVCLACGWADEQASGWLLAEEEGGLDQIVRTRPGRAAGSKPTHDKVTRDPVGHDQVIHSPLAGVDSPADLG
jgi:hypothetical protein